MPCWVYQLYLLQLLISIKGSHGRFIMRNNFIYWIFKHLLPRILLHIWLESNWAHILLHTWSFCFSKYVVATQYVYTLLLLLNASGKSRNECECYTYFSQLLHCYIVTVQTLLKTNDIYNMLSKLIRIWPNTVKNSQSKFLSHRSRSSWVGEWKGRAPPTFNVLEWQTRYINTQTYKELTKEIKFHNLSWGTIIKHGLNKQSS